MSLSYEKLWKLMKENRMNKKDLRMAAELTTNTMSKLKNNQPVNIRVLMNICKVYHCDIGDIMEVILDD